MGKDNNIISKYDEMQINLSPTLKDIEDLCGFKLKKIKDDLNTRWASTLYGIYGRNLRPKSTS